MAAIVDNRKATRQHTAQPATRTAPVAPPHPTHVTVLPHPRKAPGGLRYLPNVAPSPVQTKLAPYPMGLKGTKAARAAKNFSLRSPMVAAVVCASFAVTILCCYVSAYAKVNADRLELSRLRQDLKAAKKQETALNGEISRHHLSAPARASAMGLMPAPPDVLQVLSPAPTENADAEPVAPGTPDAE